MIRSPLIIDVASGRPAWLRHRDRVMSVAMWLLYLYLIREVFFDIRLLVVEAYEWAFLEAPRPDLPEVFRFLYVLGLYVVVVTVNGAILIGWASYNRYRFRGADDRQAISPVSAVGLGRFFGASGEQVAEWQNARSLVMIHDADGKLIAGVPKPAAIDRAAG